MNPNLDRWFELANPLAGTVLGRTTARNAVVYQRAIAAHGTQRDVTAELVTETLNLASGLGNSQQVRNNEMVFCAGRSHRKWFCMSEAVADVVVEDLRERVVPARRQADPVVVLMVQEARPMMVDAIAARLAARFSRPVSTLFVIQQPDLSRAYDGGTCDDGDPPVTYRCEYGNALLATVPLVPTFGVNFTHEPENRMLVAAEVAVGTSRLTVATYHAQIDEPSRRGQQAEERMLIERLFASLPGPIIVGGDFNDAAFDLAGFTKQQNWRRRVDAYLSRPGLRTACLRTRRARTLDAGPYELDHKRLAVKWAAM